MEKINTDSISSTPTFSNSFPESKQETSSPSSQTNKAIFEGTTIETQLSSSTLERSHDRLIPTDSKEGVSTEEWHPSIQVENTGTSSSKPAKSNLLRVKDQLKDPLLSELNFRTEIIDKKIKSLQKSLQSFPENKNNKDKYGTLISLLEKAKSYQEKCTTYLLRTADSKRKKSQFASTLKAIESLNNHPNKTEKLAGEVEVEFSNLEQYQNKLAELEHILQELPNHLVAPQLTEASDLLGNAISRQQNLIKTKVDFASSITLPFLETNPLSKQTQLSIVTSHKIGALQAYYQAQKEIDTSNNLSDPVHYIEIALDNLDKADEENEKSQPNQEAINYFLQAAKLFEEAASALKTSDINQARYLYNRAISLKEVALEYQKSTPAQPLIKAFLKAEKLFEEASISLKNNNSQKALYLNNRGMSFLKGTLEAQKPQHNENVIKHFFTAVKLRKKALTALEAGKTNQASYFENSANCFDQIALETQKIQPNQEVINHLLQAANLFQKASTSLNIGNNEQAIKLNNNGTSLYQVTLEILNA